MVEAVIVSLPIIAWRYAVHSVSILTSNARIRLKTFACLVRLSFVVFNNTVYELDLPSCIRHINAQKNVLVPCVSRPVYM